MCSISRQSLNSCQKIWKLSSILKWPTIFLQEKMMKDCQSSIKWRPLIVKALFHNLCSTIRHQISWLYRQQKAKILGYMISWYVYQMVMRNLHVPPLKWQSLTLWKIKLQRLLQFKKQMIIPINKIIMEDFRSPKFKEMEFSFFRFSLRRELKNYQTVSTMKQLNLRYWISLDAMDMLTLLWFHMHLSDQKLKSS